MGQGHAAASWFHAQVGDHEQARVHGERALALFRENDSVEGEAGTLDTLGYVAQQSGDPELAVTRYGEAAALFRQNRNEYLEAEILDRLGHVHLELGQHAEARAVLSRAHDLYRERERPTQAQRVREVLDGLPPSR